MWSNFGCLIGLFIDIDCILNLKSCPLAVNKFGHKKGTGFVTFGLSNPQTYCMNENFI